MIEKFFDGLDEKKWSKSQLSLVLEVASTISPLYLVVKHRLHEIRSWSREALFNVGTYYYTLLSY